VGTQKPGARRCAAYGRGVRTRVLVISLLSVLGLVAAAPAGATVLDGGYESGGGSDQPRGRPVGGGGSHGSYYYHELMNLDHRLKWSRAKSAIDRGRHLPEKSRERKQYLAAAYRALIVDACRISPSNPQGLRSSTCPIWFYYDKTRKSPSDDPRDYDGYNIRHTGKYPGHEIHARSMDGGMQYDGFASAYSVRIWREGRSAPIFERRIGPSGGGSQGADPPGTTQEEFYGGPGPVPKAWTEGGPQAGPITALHRSRHRPCVTRWEKVRDSGADSGLEKEIANSKPDINGRYNNRQVIDCVFRYRDFADPLSWMAGGERHFETLKLTAVIPANGKGSTTGTVKYVFSGKPKTAYVLQIVATDVREQLIDECGMIAYIAMGVPSRKPESSKSSCSKTLWEREGRGRAPWMSANYFHVDFFGDCAEGDPECPVPETQEPEDPVVSGDLLASSPNTTRTPADHWVSITANYRGFELDSANTAGSAARQASFVRRVDLRHWTPQLRVSAAARKLHNGQLQQVELSRRYSKLYASYFNTKTGRSDDMGWQYSFRYVSEPSMQPGPNGEHLDEIRLPQPPNYLAYSNPQASSKAVNIAQALNSWQITWLQPTLSNPCSGQVGHEPARGGKWPPANGSSCPQDDPAKQDAYINAWDDQLRAFFSYEERRVVFPTLPRGSDFNEVGVITNQHLRCDDMSRVWQYASASEIRTNRGNNAHPTGFSTCSKTRHELENYGSNRSKQSAIGYLFAGNPSKLSERAIVNVVLDSNRQDLVSDVAFWRRDTGEAVAAHNLANGYPINTVTNRRELWYCKQGAPIGSKLDTGSAASASDDLEITSSYNGEYAADRLEDYTASTNPASVLGCAGWTVKWRWDDFDPDSYDPAAPEDNTCQLYATTPGVGYGPYRVTEPRDVPNVAQTLGSYPAGWPIPYDGKRPGAGSNEKDCYLNVPGFKRDGWYFYDYQWVKAPRYNPKTKANQQYCLPYTLVGVKYLEMLAEGIYPIEQANPADSDFCRDTRGNPIMKDNPYRDVDRRAKVETLTWGYWVRTRAKIAWDDNSCRPYWEFTGTDPLAHTRVYAGRNYPAKTDENDPKAKLAPAESPSSNPRLGISTFIATGTTSKNKKAAAHSDPDFWAKFTCTVRVPGKVTTGKWVLSRMPQRGFGVNNSGPKIRGGGYVIKADYNVPATINPETVWWDLSANYEGPKRWLWQTRWQTNDPDDAATSAAISVYGPRNAR
jgi:hypothetical protein